jgi:hypothetical protein
MKDRIEEPIELQKTHEKQLSYLTHGKITVNVANFDYLIGKLFTHVELLGLPDRQLSAFKSTTRDMFWDWYNAFMENEMGYADPSHQWRVDAGIEKL